MNTEPIKVRVTETGQTMDVVVLNKRPEVIQVVLGTGVGRALAKDGTEVLTSSPEELA